jgi:hypothetical protein
VSWWIQLDGWLGGGGSEWSPSFVLLVATRLHGPQLNIGKN